MTAGPEAVRVLVCDHRGAGLQEALADLEEASLRLESSKSLRRSLERLAASPPDVCILDPLTGAGAVELEALERARSRPGAPPIPVLLVVGPGDPGAAVRAQRLLPAGLWDLVARDARPEELELRMRRLVEQARQASEMRELRHRASHDDRTDLLRPSTFQARLVEHFSAAQRHKHELALVLVDLDRFGAINKEHDHTVGDALIEKVGAVIRRSLRVEDVAGRLGGDEFGVVLPYTSKIDAARVVGRLRQEIETLSGRVAGAASSIRVTASLGFETFDGADLDSVDTLRRHAERALRTAKKRGGDQAVYYRHLEE